jgi:hypothetical protein
LWRFFADFLIGASKQQKMCRENDADVRQELR